MDKDDQFVHISFPNGVSYAVRQSRSGIVLDAQGLAINAELAHDILAIKMWKFSLIEQAGRC